MPEDTKFNEKERDWIKVYRHELRVAIENDDLASIKFFMEELRKEKLTLKQKNIY